MNLVVNQKLQIYLTISLKKESIMNKLYDNVDCNNLKFEYVGPTKSVSFYEFINSKELFNKIKNNQIGLNDAQIKKKLFLNRLNDVRICKKKTSRQKEVISNL